MHLSGWSILYQVKQQTLSQDGVGETLEVTPNNGVERPARQATNF
jgi:hypothetical protein